MSFPNYPNPARRAKLLRAHQLRQQGLTLRQIAQRMDCAHSTVAGYLSDFEQFRADLTHELAADQIVSHLIQLADVADEHHERRLSAVRELRLLLNSISDIRRSEDDRTRELTQASVSVDRYGNRYPMPNRMYPPTPEELAQTEQPLTPARIDPDQPLACPTEPTSDSIPTQHRGGRNLAVTAGGSPSEPLSPNQTNLNKSEQEITQNPAHNGTSADTDQHSPPPAEQPEHSRPGAVPDSTRRLLEYSERDWINDYPSHNPDHPLRLAALQLQTEAEQVNPGSPLSEHLAPRSAWQEGMPQAEGRAPLSRPPTSSSDAPTESDLALT